MTPTSAHSSVRTGALFALASLLVALASGCRGGLGTTCRCAADCRSGLVCTAEGEKSLTAELCYKPGVSGVCVESEDPEDSGAPFELTDGPLMDLGPYSKRDFQPSGSISDSVTGTGTTGTTGSTGTTDATTGTTVDTTTGTTDATGTSSTGSTSTTGSTGTTTVDTTTGTGTTAGSSSTSTSSSSSGSSGSTGTT